MVALSVSSTALDNEVKQATHFEPYLYQVNNPITPDRLYLKPLAISADIDILIRKIIHCESGGNPLAFNRKDPNGGSFGILQFQKATFLSWCVDRYGLENDIWNATIQIECAKRMIQDGQIRQWTCGRKYLDQQ